MLEKHNILRLFVTMCLFGTIILLLEVGSMRHLGVFLKVIYYQPTSKSSNNSRLYRNLICDTMMKRTNDEPGLRQLKHTSSAENSHRHIPTNCTKQPDPFKAEDILCMKPPQYINQFKNPCWYDVLRKNDNSNQILKCLPYFNIFGVCKSATTDLFYRLTQHPQIIDNLGDFGNETWFWSWKIYGRGTWNGRRMTVDQFSKLFNSKAIQNATLVRNDGSKFSNAITGYVDPMDFWDHTSWRQIPQNDPDAAVPIYSIPYLIRHILPDMKLILLLQEPSERLYSYYYHDGLGHTPYEFHRDVVFSLDIFKKCLSLFDIERCIYGKQIMDDLSIPLSASLYSFHLREWLKVFPLKQIYIIQTEDYSKNIGATLKNIFQFLNVEPMDPNHLQRVANVPIRTRTRYSRRPMLGKTKKLLADFFATYNCRLAGMLNDDRYLWQNG